MSKIGVGLSRIDHDEWSWAVERLNEERRTTLRIVAEGCARSKAEAVASIKAEIHKLGLTLDEVTVLPF